MLGVRSCARVVPHRRGRSDEAAERLNRQWVAIDLWKETKDLKEIS